MAGRTVSLISRRGRTSALALVLALAVVGTAYGLAGVLTQFAGTAGCVSETGSGGACADGAGLDGALSLAMSRDGKHVYVASFDSNAVAVFARSRKTGVLTQLAGTAGCVSEDGSGGACADGTGLNGAVSLAVSRDGRHVYAASFDSNAVAVFARGRKTGVLTQLAGTAGCVSEDGSGGACADGTGLDAASSVAVSPDGKHVYVTSAVSDAVAVFVRDRKTGVLTQLAGTAGCVSEDGSGGACADGTGLDNARSVAVSPDGRHVYVASANSNAVAVFVRDGKTGVLTQLAGTAGCVSENGSGGACADGAGLDGAFSVAVGPNGGHVYVASANSNAVAVFVRDRKTGVLTQLAGTAGCVSEDGSGGACTDGTGLAGARSVAVSPNGRHVYVASLSSDAVAALMRDRKTGVLTQLAGTAGCVSEDGSGGACTDGTGLAGARSVAVSPDGKHVYVASSGSDAVAAFLRAKR